MQAPCVLKMGFGRPVDPDEWMMMYLLFQCCSPFMADAEVVPDVASPLRLGSRAGLTTNRRVGGSDVTGIYDSVIAISGIAVK